MSDQVNGSQDVNRADPHISLTDFLLARIAEDEAVARAAGGEEWYGAEVPGMTMRKHPDDPTTTIIDSPKTLVAYDVVSDAMAAHIAAHSPADVLAECEAKRRIVELHTYPAACCYWTQGGNDSHEPGEVCETLAALALPYADHPDYREDWKP